MDGVGWKDMMEGLQNQAVGRFFGYMTSFKKCGSDSQSSKRGQNGAAESSEGDAAGNRRQLAKGVAGTMVTCASMVH